MATGKLTGRLIEAVRPAERDRFIWDTDVRGFGVKVTPAGRRVFVFQYRPAAAAGVARTRVLLGEYAGPPSVEDMRRLARIEAGRVAAAKAGHGPYPHELRRDAKVAQHPTTVADVATAYLQDREAAGRKARTVQEYRRLFAKNILPALGAHPVQALTFQQVRQWHRSLQATPALADRAVHVLGQCLRYAEREGWRSRGDNPCVGIEPLRSKRRSPKRSLTPDEYESLGAALRAAECDGLPPAPALAKKRRGMSAARRAKATGKTRGPYLRRRGVSTSPANPIHIAALRFLALSGWRKGEVFQLRWEQLRLSDGVAILPDSKTGRSVRPLGRVAIAHLQSLQHYGASGFVFANLTSGRAMQEPKHTWSAVRHKAGLPLRLHDLRHSFATMAHRLGFGDHVIAALLGHSGSSMTARYGDVPDSVMRDAADRIADAIAQAMGFVPSAAGSHLTLVSQAAS